ncbi:hypothetical protein IP92_02813 [Pseudoduganella flava]|uniref:DUF4426 domain-containing protein n=1 Tax=Pseudoduganella flava TaxID=871742 RepID=A0A562PTH7_9BURK|nr:hypothetical protein [Pseudoduganella flava]QGZ38983.1 hypothetical protein GO485_07935 [Pseudoduganella flava]TWI47752.1 hypothetical protein IP92_02813 [Pseudoduganella flava]
MRYLWTGCVAALGLAADAAAMAPELPVTTFLSTCMSAQANLEAVRIAAEGRGFVVALPEHKAKLLRNGADGDAYAAREAALVVERGRPMCTLFARSDDPQATRAALAKMLPPPTTRFTFEQEDVPGNPELLRVAYRLKLDGKPYAKWVFSAYPEDGPFNVAITLQMSR